MSSAIAAMSIADAAASTGVSRSQLYKLIREQRGPRITKIGGRSVILIKDRDEWLRRLSQEAAA